MPINNRTLTVAEIASRVKRQFGDESGVQITDADIIRWVNDGQREIVSKNQILQARAVSNVVSNQAEYTFPVENILSIMALKYNGRRLKNMSYQEAEDYLTENDPERTSTGDPEFWTLWAGSIRLYPTPVTAITNGLVLDYVKVPDTVTALTNVISIPDRYFNTLLHYVLAQAYELDEDWTAAGNKFSQLEASLNSLSEEESHPQQEYYPFITVLDGDY